MTPGAQSLDQRFAGAMGDLLGPDFPSDIALAVSGGGDSMAMLTLAHNWAHVWGTRLWVVTIDHGLRPEAAQEAALVRETCAELGHPHATLRWHRDGTGNVMAEARAARLALIDRWRGGLRHVLMAHTRDDVAETFLMRLRRGSGVDGLAAMAPRRVVAQQVDVPGEITGDAPPTAPRDGGYEVLRPCLSMRRAELRHYLSVLKGRWVDDPSNDDDRFERVRMRRLLADLDAQGLGADCLADTAQRMARSREALARRAADIRERIGVEPQVNGVPTGEIVIDRDGLAPVERETQLRLLAAALQYVASADYRPRADALEAALDRLLSGGSTTLHGCELRCERARIRVFREYSAVAGHLVQMGPRAVWDGRWRLENAALEGLCIRALGEDGWRQVAVKPDVAPPFVSARSLPSVWDGEELIACPAMGVGPACFVALRPANGAAPDFRNFLLSH